MLDNIDRVIEIVGGIVALLSALSSWVNHNIRTKQADGQPVSTLMLGAGAVLNTGAINLDKAAQLAKQLRAQKAAPAADTQQP